MTLPAGLTTRPLTVDDAAAVTAVMAADEIAAIGEAQIAEADIIGDWQRPSFDITASTVGVFDGDSLIGYAERSGADRGDAAVHPDHQGLGIGTWLALWLQETARSAGSTTIGMPVPQGSAGDRLLETLGYRIRWTSWILALPPDARVPARPLPTGFSVRDATPSDHRAAWTVIEDAFLEWSVRERESFEDFAAGVVHRPGFEPWQLRVVVDPAGDVVGAAQLVVAGDCAYVERLAVRRDRRGAGLAQALLADGFALARAHGTTRSELSTDSRTGALGLYEKVGMVVTSTWNSRAISLTG